MMAIFQGFLSSADFSKLTFTKNLSETLLKYQMVMIQIRTAVLSVLLWVQTVCQSHQQMPKVAASKEGVKLIFIYSKTCLKLPVKIDNNDK